MGISGMSIPVRKISEHDITFDATNGHNHDGANSRRTGRDIFLGIDYYDVDFTGTYYAYTPMTGATKVLVMAYYYYYATSTTSSYDAIVRISKGTSYPGTTIEKSIGYAGNDDRVRHHTITAYVPITPGEKIYVYACGYADFSVSLSLCVFLNFA